MTTDDLTTALRVCAIGIYPLEAGVALLISNGTFLHRDDFTSRFIEHGATDGTTMAAIDWDAAITALNSGSLPCSGGERRILQLSASLADGIPVSLRDTISGLDDRNVALVVSAIQHAAGKRPLTARYRQLRRPSGARALSCGHHGGTSVAGLSSHPMSPIFGSRPRRTQASMARPTAPMGGQGRNFSTCQSMSPRRAPASTSMVKTISATA